MVAAAAVLRATSSLFVLVEPLTLNPRMSGISYPLNKCDYIIGVTCAGKRQHAIFKGFKARCRNVADFISDNVFVRFIAKQTGKVRNVFVDLLDIGAACSTTAADDYATATGDAQCLIGSVNGFNRCAVRFGRGGVR